MRRVQALLLAVLTTGTLSIRQGVVRSSEDAAVADSRPDVSAPRVEISHTTENLRGVSAVSRDVAWASGAHGTYLRTMDGGRTWTAGQLPDVEGLDFRAVVGFSADEAFLMSAGSGELSRIYHTSDGGAHWQLQFSNTNPGGFFDSMAFWDRTHGMVLGDPVADASGELRFEVLVTEDGEKWQPISAKMPPAVKGEGAFAASNSCIAVLPSASDGNIWFGTGGKTARVFHSRDRGQTWEVSEAPILHGAESAGIFSIAFRDALHGVVAGGDYKRPNEDGPNLAFTEDGGKTWKLSDIRPQAYFSAVAYDREVQAEAARQHEQELRTEEAGKKVRVEPEQPQRLFLVGQDFVLVFRPPANPRRIGGEKKLDLSFNAVSAYPEGGALIVGKNGSVVQIP